MQYQFQNIQKVLSDLDIFWRFDPFHCSNHLPFSWQSQFPDFCYWISQLTISELQLLQASPIDLYQQASRYLPQLKSLQIAIDLPKTNFDGLSVSRGLDSGIPGRKWQQIIKMGEASIKTTLINSDKSTLDDPTSWLEWCAGKGYLGRVLADATGKPVTSFEYQHALCCAGQQFADAHQLPINFIEGDAFSDATSSVFNRNKHVVALHACGDLHVQLLKLGCEQKIIGFTISPCCYHLIQSDYYHPLSQIGKKYDLVLTRKELRIPLLQTVTGGARVARHRQQEMIFRLGFDLLLKQYSIQEEYLPIPSLKKSQLADGFIELCQWAASIKNIELVDNIDYASLELQAQNRFWQMEKLNLVQSLFQRPLEVWLALDKVLYLQEQGYKVSLEEFCSSQITPRNLLISAIRID